MTATTEITQILKIVKNSPDLNSNIDVIVKNRIENIENEIIEYVTTCNVTMDEAFVDLYEKVITLKLLTFFFLIQHRDIIKDINHELNEIIIDIHQKRDEVNSNISHDFINIIELMRDHEIYNSIINSGNVNDLEKLLSPLLVPYEIDSAAVYRQISKNIKAEISGGLSEFYYNSLSIDFSSVLFSLKEEEKLFFEDYQIVELTKFNSKALNKYTTYFNKWKKEMDESNLGQKLQVHIQPLNDFLTRKYGEGVTLPLTSELQKSITDTIELKNLEKGWDEEDSMPVSEEYIVKAMAIICQIYIQHLRAPSFIAPTSNSGILIEYSIDNTRLDIRIEDVLAPVINYFVDKKLIENRSPFGYEKLALIWKTTQAK